MQCVGGAYGGAFYTVVKARTFAKIENRMQGVAHAQVANRRPDDVCGASGDAESAAGASEIEIVARLCAGRCDETQ